MTFLSRFWYGASVQTKYLLIIVPAALLLTIGGGAVRQSRSTSAALRPC